MARRRRKSAFPRIRFKKKFPFIKFGSPPRVHVKKLRKHLVHIEQLSERVVRHADSGNCHDAVALWGDLQWHLGHVHAHKASTSEKNYSGERYMLTARPNYKYPRQVNKARKAVETCLVNYRRA
jgi:hypothetical protein